MKKALVFASLLTCLLLASCAPKTSGSNSTSSTPDSSHSASTPDNSGSSSTLDPAGSENTSAPSSSGGTSDSSNSNRSSSQSQTSKRDQIPFADGQSYAVAHLGYQEIEDLDFYVQRYLDSADVPIHYLSSGDYYLVIPRYQGMELSIYVNNIETSDSSLFYQETDCHPFIIQCNVSDIFPDATIELTYKGETVSFSPFISLKDGSLDIGEHGLDLTKETASHAASE